jgi:hypothetical protein
MHLDTSIFSFSIRNYENLRACFNNWVESLLCLVIILHLRTKKLIRALLSLADISALYRSHHNSDHF